MKIFRIRCAANAFTLFTGVVFLNMSFLLAEISALDLDKNKRMARNLSNLIASSMAEEEPGADEDSTFSAWDYVTNHHPTAGTIAFFFSNKFDVWSCGHPSLGEFEIIKPPPQA